MFCANLGAVVTTAIAPSDYWFSTFPVFSAISDIYLNQATGNVLTNSRLANNYIVTTPAGAIDTQFGGSTTMALGRYAAAINSVGPVLGGFDTANNLTVVAHSTWAGANVWKRRISGSAQAGPVGLVVDSANNIYVGAMNDATSATNIMKLDSGGAIVWQKSVTPPILHAIYNAVGQIFAVDNSDNLIMARAGAGTNTYSYLTKFDSAGTVLWQRTFRDLTNNYLPLFVKTVTLSNGDIVCVGYYVDATTSYGLIVKYSAAGALLFQRRVTPGASNTMQLLGATVDALDNIYVSGSYDNAAGTDGRGLVMAFTSAGVLTWQRSWATTTPTIGWGFNAAANKDGAVYAAGRTDIGQCILAVPTDGSKTGVYGTYTYATTTFVDSAISVFTSATTTATTATTTTTATTVTHTIPTTSYTRTLTDIP
jgi:hypothetical protein